MGTHVISSEIPHKPYAGAPPAASWATGAPSIGYDVFLLTDTDGNYPPAALTGDLFGSDPPTNVNEDSVPPLNVPQFEFFQNLKGWNLNVVEPEGHDKDRC